MAEILDLEGVLVLLKDMQPVERVILATAGTLQAALSAYLGEPVDVRVLSQEEGGEGAELERAVELFGRSSGRLACRARTRIEVSDDVVRKLIRERSLGLGQICATLGLRATFELHAAGRHDGGLWREYTLGGPGFAFHIREDLPWGP